MVEEEVALLFFSPATTPVLDDNDSFYRVNDEADGHFFTKVKGYTKLADYQYILYKMDSFFDECIYISSNSKLQGVYRRK